MADALILPEPIGPQVAALDHPASRKVFRWGRRTGKTRAALVAAIAGHGPGPDGAKMHPGILQGGDVVWIAQDYPNLLRVAWKEEVMPRMKHLPYCTLNQQDHTATINGLGTLHFASAEAIDGIRGMGSKVVGIIIDEAAWLDLERALLDVILAILLDNNGWLIVMSTTNAGADGNSAKRVPSYFNIICEQIQAGERGADWVTFHATAFENPVISDAALKEMIAEYPPGSPKLKQEVYAELLAAGEGLAIPHCDANVHIIPAFDVPESWPRFGAFDWGWNHPWVFGEFTRSPDGVVYLLQSRTGREMQIEAIVGDIRSHCNVDRLQVVWAGTDIFAEKGKSVGYDGPTQGEKMLQMGIRVVPADTRRVMGLDNVRSYMDHVGKPPRFRLFDTPENRAVLATLARMQIDPKRPEDALKVDADAAGRGGDDAYDMVRYGLMAYPIHAPAVQIARETAPKVQDRNAGIHWKTGKPNVPPSPESALQKELRRTNPPPIPGVGRFSRP